MKTTRNSTLSAGAKGGDETQNNSIRRKWFALALGGFLFSSVLALSPSPVEAQCKQWNVGHGWRFKQGPTAVDLDLHQDGTVITGTASHVIRGTETDGIFSGGGFRNETISGEVDGTVEGNSFAVLIHWNNDTTGVYDGTIRPSGKIEGTGYNQATPSKKVNWHSETSMVCADAPAVKPSSVPKPPAQTQPAPASTPLPKLSAASAADWVGSWDTNTDQGGHFELVLKQDGDKISGTFRDLNGNPQYDGTLVGTLDGRVLTYRFAQLKATGTGVFKLDQSKQKFTGNGVALQGTAKTRFSWSGSKTN